MKLKMKLMAAAVALAASAGAHADIDFGWNGNGEFFFNIWDDNGSYTRDLNFRIDDFQSWIAAPGLLNLSFAADPLFTSFLAGEAGGVRTGAPLRWNLLATDNMGHRRIPMTFEAPSPLIVAQHKTNDVMRTLANSVGSFAANGTGPYLTGTGIGDFEPGGIDSVACLKGTDCYAGGLDFPFNIPFSNAANGLLTGGNGGMLRNSYETGMGMLRIDALATGIARATHTEYKDNGISVRAWLAPDNTLHIAAVPEAESYAMMLAGLSLLGFMARRRLNNRV